MSDSTPSDLSVAFRSLSRRLSEALEPVDGDEAVAGALIKELHGVLLDAGFTMKCDPSAIAVANAIEARHVDSWTDADLALLRAQSLNAGRILRSITATAERSAGL